MKINTDDGLLVVAVTLIALALCMPMVHPPKAVRPAQPQTKPAAAATERTAKKIVVLRAEKRLVCYKGEKEVFSFQCSLSREMRDSKKAANFRIFAGKEEEPCFPAVNARGLDTRWCYQQTLNLLDTEDRISQILIRGAYYDAGGSIWVEDPERVGEWESRRDIVLAWPDMQRLYHWADRDTPVEIK